MSFPWLHSLTPHPLPVLSSRIVQSSTWCSKMLLTSGLLVRQERSAPSSRFFITLVSATARHGNQNSSTVSPNCWGVRWSRITPLTGLCCCFFFYPAHSDFAMPDSRLSCYAVIQFDYAWWHPAPGIQENACILLTQYICWTFSWSEFSEEVQH